MCSGQADVLLSHVRAAMTTDDCSFISVYNAMSIMLHNVRLLMQLVDVDNDHHKYRQQDPGYWRRTEKGILVHLDLSTRGSFHSKVDFLLSSSRASMRVFPCSFELSMGLKFPLFSVICHVRCELSSFFWN